MKCDEFKEKIFNYYENELDKIDKKSFEEHLNTCSICKSEYEAYKKLIDDINKLPNEQLPTGYCKRLHSKLKNENNLKLRRKKRNNIIKYTSIAAIFVIVITSVYFADVFTQNLILNNDFDMSSNITEKLDDTNIGTSVYDSAKGEAYYGLSTQQSSVESSENTMSMSEQQDINNKRAYDDENIKIIKDGSLNLNTTEFDNFIADLESYIDSNNGYIEYNNTSLRRSSENNKFKTANLKLRIPQQKFDDLVQYIMEQSNVYSKVINETDVTKNYYDTKNIVTNLEIQELRLRELYEKATTVDEIIQLETEITRVRTEIDSYNLFLSDIDDRVNMATLNLNIDEIDNSINISSSKNMWEKSKEGFINSINMIIAFIQGFIVAIISYFPILIILAIILLVIYRIFKKKKSKVK